MKPTRRNLIAAGTLSAAWGMTPPLVAREDAEPATPYPGFPSIERSRVYDTVLYAHSDLDKVRALVQESPALCNAAIDWGFGDWESALGAAAHMGRVDIAEVLLEAGARPDLFAHAMLGHLDVVRAAVEAQPGVQGILGPHGFSLLFHARAGGDAARPVVAYLEHVGGANPQVPTEPMDRPKEAFAGSYRSADGVEFDIVERNGRFAFQQGEDFPKALVYRGNDAFSPGATPNVWVRFKVEGDMAKSVEIVDHTTLLTAQRVS